MLARASALAAAAASALALAAGGGDAGAAPTSAAPAPAKVETALLAAMNRARAEHGRPPLRMAATLRRPARAQSRWLAATGRLTHEGPDGRPFWTRLVAAGFPRNRWMAENLAALGPCDARTARQTVAMWLKSPGHRANLLDARYRWVGAGVAVRGGATVVTADFGS